MRSEGYGSRSTCLSVNDYSQTTGYEAAYERYQELKLLAIWLDAERCEEFNSIVIIFIA